MTTVSAHVHRFHDFAAIDFTGVDGETVYLTAPDALRALLVALDGAA